MKITSLKCPGCGASLSIAPGTMQTYCKYCNSLLVIEGNDNIQGANDEDNPISVEMVESKINGVRVWGDGEHDVYVLSGISYLTESVIPLMPEKIIKSWRYHQRIYLGGLIKGNWELKQEPENNPIQDNCEKWGFSCTKDEGVKEESAPEFLKARYPAEKDKNEKWVHQTVIYYVKALPDSIKKHPDLFDIIEGSKTNMFIKNMLNSIVETLPAITDTSDELVVEVDTDLYKGDGIRIGFFKSKKSFYGLNAYGLSKCQTVLHRYAMLAIVSAEILRKKGDLFELHGVSARHDEDHDWCSCSFIPIKIIQKNYQSW